MPYTEGNRNRMKSLSKETPENLKHPYERMIREPSHTIHGIKCTEEE